MAQTHPLDADAELIRRFQFHEAKTHDRITRHAHVRQLCAHVAGYLSEIVPDGRERSIALTKLEEVMFWANAGLARAPEAEDAALMPTEETVTNERPDSELVDAEAGA